MRALSAATNTDNSDPTNYPKRRIKDETSPGVSADGTIINEIFLGDIIQFFQKLVIDGSISENGNPDNVANGYQLVEALTAFIRAANGGLNTKIVNIEDWDMYTDGSITVAHGVTTFSNIREVYALIRNDQGTLLIPLVGGSTTGGIIGEGGTINSIGSTNITLGRLDGGIFDTTSYDSTSYNRGFLIIRHLP